MHSRRKAFLSKKASGPMDPRKFTPTNRVSTPEGEATQSNKRRSSRVVIDIPVTVFGQNSDRKIVEEKSKTVIVSAHGALVVLKTNIDPQKPVLLINIKTGSKVHCRVAYRKDLANALFEIGLEFASPLPTFWGIAFPPEDWDPADRKKPVSSNKVISPLTRNGRR